MILLLYICYAMFSVIPKSWLLYERFFRNILNPWPYGLGCDSRGYDNSRYVGVGSVQSKRAMLNTSLDDIF